MVVLVDLQAGRGAAGGQALGLAQGELARWSRPAVRPSFCSRYASSFSAPHSEQERLVQTSTTYLPGFFSVEHHVEGGDLVGALRA